jgi:hypothetical protein
MNNTKNNTENVIEQEQMLQELHEAELDSVAGAAMADCFHWKNSSKSWGF